MKVEINNYKSIAKSEIELNRGLNILIGPNGAGKTNILTSFKFLKDVIFKGAGLAVAKAGGPSRVYNTNAKSLKFVIVDDINNKTVKRRPAPFQLKWSIQIAQKGEENIASIINESLCFIAAMKEGKKEILRVEISRNNVKRPRAKLYINWKMDPGRNLLDNYDNDHRQLNKAKLFDKLSNELRDTLKRLKSENDRSLITSISIYDQNVAELLSNFSRLNEFNIIPEEARKASEQLPYARMQSNGYGIGEVIDALIKKNFHKVELSNSFDIDIDLPFFLINRILGRSFMFGRPRGVKSKNPLETALSNIQEEIVNAVQPIEKIDVEIDPTNGKRFVVFKTESEKFYPDQVSDGTIKWLCILASIYVGSSSIYLIEEPENFLHPWMQQRLVEIMRNQSDLNKSIFILTSHSSTVMNSSYIDEIITVEATDKGTLMKKIKNRKEVEKFLENSNFRLGDLWISGGLGAIPQ